MSIREKIIDGKSTYEVSISIRSRIHPDLRVQKMRTQIRTHREALNIEKELLKEVAGELVRREGSEVTWSVLQEKWEIAHRKYEPDVKPEFPIFNSTVMDTVSTLRRFTKDWDKKPCHEISPGDVRRVIATMEEQGYSKSRLKAVRSGINVLFKWGVEEGMIRSVHHSPAMGVQLTRIKDEKPPQILNIGEIHKLLESAKAMDNEWYPIWAMALRGVISMRRSIDTRPS